MEIVGDRNPIIARKLQPNSIRAIYGRTEIQNAIEISSSHNMYEHNIQILFKENWMDIHSLSMTNSYSSNNNHMILHNSNMSILNKIKNRTTTSEKEEALIILQPYLTYDEREQIRIILEQNEFHITLEKTHMFSFDVCMDIFVDEFESDILDLVCQQFSSGELIAWILEKPDIFHDLPHMIGDTDTDIARTKQPMSVRALYGKDRIRNVCYFSGNVKIYERLFAKFFFDDDSAASGSRSNSSCNKVAHFSV